MDQESRANPRVRAVPDLLYKEVAAAMIALAAVCLISSIADAPIQGPADPAALPPEHVKAPWIFVGIQQALRYLPPLLAGVLAPLSALLLFAAIPFIPLQRRMLAVLFSALTLLAVALTLWGYLA